MLRQYQWLMLATVGFCSLSSMEKPENFEKESSLSNWRDMRRLLDELPPDINKLVAHDLVVAADPNFYNFMPLIKERYAIGNPGDFIPIPVLSPDNSKLLLKTQDVNDTQDVHVFDIKEGSQYHWPYQGQGIEQGVEHAFSPNGNCIASYDTDGNLDLWDTKTGVQIKRLTTYNNQAELVFPHILVFRPQTNQLLFPNHEQQCVDLWDIELGSRIKKIPLDTDLTVNLLVCSHDGTYVLIAVIKNQNAYAIVWDLINDCIVHRFNTDDCLYSAASWSRDGKFIAIATHNPNPGNSDSIQIWNIESGKCIAAKTTPFGHDSEHSEHRVTYLSFPCNNSVLLITHSISKIFMWMPFSKKNIKKFGTMNTEEKCISAINDHQCIIVRDSIKGVVLDILDFSGLERIYDYLYHGTICLDQAMLLSALENSKTNNQKYGLDPESKKIFESLLEDVRALYQKQVFERSWYLRCLDRVRRVLDNATVG